MVPSCPSVAHIDVGLHNGVKGTTSVTESPVLITLKINSGSLVNGELAVAPVLAVQYLEPSAETTLCL